ncbi:HlyD family secretion protein [Flavobacterium sp. S87F.05.LMB.W.Kidney.N]|uniref:HlyD family secretion protein n=1 Tax=Flavobacterium sp. S87F.05.LMB.W.Kidney.N TaxID=1278758 RepID=UPI001066E81E|nr:HlyD family secretion protein [Flavobacterium sp. S87F.05.LMB.W.Kidney.N]TDX12740.1 membrane fusion protein (multidrug efflux system) [Flavobacterium sp. S87F.05.LMB.W.Kidney.N]
MSEENKPAEGIQKDKKRNTILTIISFVFLAAGGLWILSLFFDFSNYETTNNAQVEAYISNVSARASGHIAAIRFETNQVVHKGDTLVILDDSEYLIKVSQAEADLAIAVGNLHSLEQTIITSSSNQSAAKEKLAGDLASLEKAQKDYQRFKNMYADSAVTRNQYDQVVSKLRSEEAYLKAGKKGLDANNSVTKQSNINLEAARATVARKKADLEAVKLQLSYTNIIAPADGIAGERNLSIGELINANQVIATIVLNQKLWVSANFKETQIRKIKIGQQVVITIDALGEKEFRGKVTGFSPATGAKFSMVEPDNATGNFVKITQRIPVKIEFESEPKDLEEVKPGMNVTVEVKK